MVINFIKILILIFPFACFGLDEGKETYSQEYLIYLEETNFRINNILILNKILKELKAIRCQNEPEYCIEEGEDNGE